MTTPSYESTVDHFGLTDQQLGAECRDEHLRLLASRLNNWRNIDFQLEKGVLDAIGHEPVDDEGKRRKLLERWKEAYGHEATYERLVRCLVDSQRMDLAGFVCGTCKKAREERNQSSTPSTPVENKGRRAMSKPCRVFPSDALPDGSVESQSNSRNVLTQQSDGVEPAVGTEGGQMTLRLGVGGKESFVRCDSAGEQEQHDGQRSSRMVTNSGAHGTRNSVEERSNSGSTSPKLLDMLNSSFSLLHREKNEKSDISRSLEKKKRKVKELKQRKERVEGFLVEKEEKLLRYELEARKMQLELDGERAKQQESQDGLEKKEKKIKWLKDNIYQKETELKREKEEKQLKCERLTELESELQQTHDDLEREKKAKEDTVKELTHASRRIETLEKDVEKANSEVEVTCKEREKVKSVLKWTEEDLEEEKEVVSELHGTLLRQREIMTTYRSIMIFLIAILVGLLLYSMGILQ